MVIRVRHDNAPNACNKRSTLVYPKGIAKDELVL
jgi:hypothetical protein